MAHNQENAGSNPASATMNFKMYCELYDFTLYVCIGKPDPEAHGILAHEIMHATFAILRRSGMKFSQKSEEAYTYLAEWITEKIYRKILKQ